MKRTVQASSSTASTAHKYWPSARQYTEAIQCPSVCFFNPKLRGMLPAIDRLGMPLVTSGQFAYVYKLKSQHAGTDVAVRCFRGYLGDRNQRYLAIQRHLDSNPVPALSNFTYAPDGILVSGNRFPILFMDWIEGPTLDLYMDVMIGRKEVLLHLSREWLKLITSLRDAEVAHGDLQHGNIIVEHGKLRLVDHDGLFVPEMSDWTASEVGHQHYQHPLRDPQQFNANLDNFSAIVIYLSLISLAEQPGLWKQYHDENLLFTRSDYLDPSASPLFGKISELGAEHRELADILATAAKGDPEAVPCLLDIVSNKSSLPLWMNQPIDLESRVKTREAEIQHPTAAHNPRWVPWHPKPDTSSLPSTPPSETVQTLFGGPIPQNWTNLRDPSAVWRNTPILAKEMLGKTFVWWYWGIYCVLTIFGFDFLPSFALALICLAAVCLTFGYIRARQVATGALQRKLAAQASAAAPLTLLKPTGVTTPTLPAPTSITSKDPIVGNMALSIYHVGDCDWVKKIVARNRITFASTGDASSAGYKPCRVCSPVL